MGSIPQKAIRKASGPPGFRSPGVTLVQIANRQRIRVLDRDLIAGLLLDLLEHRKVTAELGFHFVGTREMAQVNWDYLRHEGSTDIITFDHGSRKGHLHGECFICVADAVAQAEEFGRPWTEELARYVIHGILHLEGFDDLEPSKRRRMKSHENRLVRWAAKRGNLDGLGSDSARTKPRTR